MADPLAYGGETDAHCLHVINLLLEYFGECEVLDSNLDSIIGVQVQRLNWHVLPEGTRPWGQLRQVLTEHIKDLDATRNAAFRSRLDRVNSYGPTFAAVGKAGFNGYVIFGFPGKNLAVCESIYKYNATYVFGENWREVSQLTKTQVLDGNFHLQRIIHMPGWVDQIESLLR